MFNRYMKMVVVMTGIYAGSYALAMDQGAGAGALVLVKTCICCTDQKPLTDFRPLEDCLHAEYCRECWQGLIDDRITRKDLGIIPCPYRRDSFVCPHRLTPRDITHVTGDDLRTKALNKIKEEVIASSIEQPISDPIMTGNQMCPCCGVEIEKNQGCNEVWCTHCALASCWDCGRPFWGTGGHLAFPQGHGYGAGYVAGSTACQKPSLLPGLSSMNLNEQLFEAVTYNLPYLVRLLVVRGAKIDAVNSNQESALMIAVTHGHLPVIKALVEKCHANMEGQDNKGNTVLISAARTGNLEVIKYLVEQCHPNIEEKGNCGFPVLHIAAGCGYLEIVQYLVEKCHANSKTKGRDDMTVLMSAAISGHVGVIKYIIQQYDDAYTEEKNSDMRKALMCAACGGHLVVVQYFVEQCGLHGARVDALKLAACAGRLEVMQYLVEQCGPHIGEKDMDGVIEFVRKTPNKGGPVEKYLQDYVDKIKSQEKTDALKRSTASDDTTNEGEASTKKRRDD